MQRRNFLAIFRKYGTRCLVSPSFFSLSDNLKWQRTVLCHLFDKLRLICYSVIGTLKIGKEGEHKNKQGKETLYVSKRN